MPSISAPAFVIPVPGFVIPAKAGIQRPYSTPASVGGVRLRHSLIPVR